jgi:hypothetical protein
MPLNAGISLDALPPQAASGLHHGKGKVKVVTLAGGSRIFRGGQTLDRHGKELPQGDTATWAFSPRGGSARTSIGGSPRSTRRATPRPSA